MPSHGSVHLPADDSIPTLSVTSDDAETREYQLPRGAHINVQEGERVRAGEARMEGPIDHTTSSGCAAT
jgi:hypothetical protein